jgi:hypothetical protein
MRTRSRRGEGSPLRSAVAKTNQAALAARRVEQAPDALAVLKAVADKVAASYRRAQRKYGHAMPREITDAMTAAAQRLADLDAAITRHAPKRVAPVQEHRGDQPAPTNPHWR